LEKITIDDYLLLVSLFTQKGFDRIDLKDFEHLVEAAFTGLTQGRVRTILQELTADELIVKVGDYRHIHYRINES